MKYHYLLNHNYVVYLTTIMMPPALSLCPRLLLSPAMSFFAPCLQMTIFRTPSFLGAWMIEGIRPELNMILIFLMVHFIAHLV